MRGFTNKNKGEKTMEETKKAIEGSRDFTPKEIYLWTHVPKEKSKGIKELAGTIVTVGDWLVHEGFTRDGEICDVLTLKDGNADVYYSTNSKTFIREFLNMVELFKDDLHSIKIDKGVAKSGNEFVICYYND